ncbi:hypothetical protein FLAV_01841 [Flavobacteriales bacterium]|nr:hypothetical protein [Flavobacteriales bacterium]MCL4817009.1 universal stress protein [Flavobacteriales bacterium]WKZ74370.1 MAG: universal stress protein [Vicingaceae bacterium]GIK70553.1 MAG: universal stress protein UspA [Bacteroidota bacterium]CAG0982431.1 hypothetical protein FLAV_01841 [Flavobacteriales bacterium]
MKNILVPTDFSSCATLAAHQAILIAQQTKSSISFIHSINTPVEWIRYNPSVPTKRAASLNAELDQFPEFKKQMASAKLNLEILKKEAEKKKVSASTDIAFNQVYSDIIEYAKAKKADLIVMGTVGNSGLKAALIGSNTSKIIRISTLPVLAISPKHQVTPITGITYTSDFEEENLNKNIIEIKNLALSTKASLKLLYINTPTFFESTKYSIQKLNNIMLKYKLAKCDYAVYNDFTVEEGISNYIQSHPTNLVAISTHNRKGIARLFYDNITELLLGKLDKPLLIFPRK